MKNWKTIFRIFLLSNLGVEFCFVFFCFIELYKYHNKMKEKLLFLFYRGFGFTFLFYSNLYICKV